MSIIIINEGTNILVSGAFLKCFIIYKNEMQGGINHTYVFS